MKLKYEHLFFDLDHTLWDFDTNSKNTLYGMFEKYDLERVTGVNKEGFYKNYLNVNRSLWYKYQHGQITKEQLRKDRFRAAFAAFDYYEPEFFALFETEYVSTCPHQTAVMPGTFELLDYLKTRYELHIITNGFVESQATKMSKSGLGVYFKHVISSDAIGVNKPHPSIFEKSMSLAGAQPTHSLMIGDNLETDIKGAQGCGIDQVFFNPEKEVHNGSPTFEVSHLLQMKDFL